MKYLFKLYLLLMGLIIIGCSDHSEVLSDSSESKGGGTEVVGVLVPEDGIQLEAALSGSAFKYQFDFKADSSAKRLFDLPLDLVDFHLAFDPETQQLYAQDSTTLYLPFSYTQGVLYRAEIIFTDSTMSLSINERLIWDVLITDAPDDFRILSGGGYELFSMELSVQSADEWSVVGDFRDDEGQLEWIEEWGSVTHLEPTETYTWSQQIQQSTDDAEEYSDGYVSLSSSDLDMMNDLSDTITNAYVGLRFVSIPLDVLQGLQEAYIQFQGDDSAFSRTILEVGLESSSDCVSFDQQDIGSRPLTSPRIIWDIPTWESLESSSKSALYGLSTLVKSLDLSAADSEVNLCFIIQGSGNRDAKSYDYDPFSAPRLVLKYQ